MKRFVSKTIHFRNSRLDIDMIFSDSISIIFGLEFRKVTSGKYGREFVFAIALLFFSFIITLNLVQND